MPKTAATRKPKTRRTIHICDDDWRDLDRIALSQGTSAATLVRQFVKLGLREYRRREK